FCTHWSSPLSVVDSLYFQCAAKPFSAISFILLVRICTSTHCPLGPITVVCSDSYPFALGEDIQSRSLSGLGLYRSVTIEYAFQQSAFSCSGVLSKIIRMAKRSYTSSNGMAFFFILFHMEWIDFGLPNISASSPCPDKTFFTGSIKSFINFSRS